MNVTVTLECEKGHLEKETAIKAWIDTDGSVHFLATSGWYYCDPCGEEDESGEYIDGSTVRSEESRLAGYKEVEETLLFDAL